MVYEPTFARCVYPMSKPRPPEPANAKSTQGLSQVYDPSLIDAPIFWKCSPRRSGSRERSRYA